LGTRSEHGEHVEHTQNHLMLREFKVLLMKIGKRKTAHWSLFCDESLADFGAHAVVES
jgi:hypothetical protein